MATSTLSESCRPRAVLEGWVVRSIAPKKSVLSMSGGIRALRRKAQSRVSSEECLARQPPEQLTNGWIVLREESLRSKSNFIRLIRTKSTCTNIQIRKGRPAMSTPKNPQPKRSLLAFSPDSLERIRQKLAQANPPNLRVSKDYASCGSCENFTYTAGRSWKGDGWCSRYAQSPVRSDFVCNDFSDVGGEK